VTLGSGAICVIFLPFITGTLNPFQMATNLGFGDGEEVSNDRKFKNNGEVMNHGTGFGHKWYKTDAYVNGGASPSLISSIGASFLSEHSSTQAC
jgi:hypothetical protein